MTNEKQNGKDLRAIRDTILETRDDVLAEAIAVRVDDTIEHQQYVLSGQAHQEYTSPGQAQAVVVFRGTASLNPPVRDNRSVQCCYPVRRLMQRV